MVTVVARHQFLLVLGLLLILVADLVLALVVAVVVILFVLVLALVVLVRIQPIQMFQPVVPALIAVVLD